jgi:hypothetical protein
MLSGESDSLLTGSDSDIRHETYNRLGIGLNIRIKRNFAIHPEFTILRNYDRDLTMSVIGLGVNLGALPSYD